MSRIRTPYIEDSIRRCINSINDGVNAVQAEAALRNFCCAIITERDRSWLDVADELVGERLGKMAQEDAKFLDVLARLAEARSDTEVLRAILLEFAKGCNSYNISFLAAGLGSIQSMFRSQEQGNVVEALEQVAKA